jgi:hypothetical protein
MRYGRKQKVAHLLQQHRAFGEQCFEVREQDVEQTALGPPAAPRQALEVRWHTLGPATSRMVVLPPEDVVGSVEVDHGNEHGARDGRSTGCAHDPRLSWRGSRQKRQAIER